MEGVKNNHLETLDLLENGITSLGCQFLGKAVANPFSCIKHLKLDNNLIGNEGLEEISKGLRVNSCITKLSLKQCGIDARGARHIQDILANISTQIRSLKLQGNPLNNDGLYQVLRAVNINEMLEKINVADIGLNLLAFKAKHIIKV